MSRPARAGEPGRLLNVRVTDAERERWEAAAIRSRTDLSSWLRSIADRAAVRAQAAAPPGTWDAALVLARKARRRRR